MVNSFLHAVMLKDIYDLLMKLVMFAVFVVNLSKFFNDAYLYAALVLCKFVSQSHSFTNLLAGSVSAILRRPIQFKGRHKLISVSEMQLMLKLRKSCFEAIL